MKRWNASWPLLCLSLLWGCALVPGENADGKDTREWCSRDVGMPWTGCWTEVAQLDCESGEEFEPAVAIGEFRLTPDWRYSVTWSPFETYVDYAGQYRVSEEEGAIELTLGNLAPPQAKGRGSFSVTDQGELLLEGIWLGARDHGSATEACGHRFRLRTKR
jgi:hypothetical protein